MKKSILKKIEKNEAAKVMVLKVESFEPANREAILNTAARNTRDLVENTIVGPLRTFLWKMRYVMTDDVKAYKMIASRIDRRLTVEDLQLVNMVVNELNTFADIPEKGINGYLKVIVEAISSDRDAKKAMKQLRKNFPQEAAVVLQGIASILSSSAVAVTDPENTETPNPTVKDYISKVLDTIENIPIEVYEGLLGMILQNQIDDIKNYAGGDIVARGEMVSESVLADIELRAKKQVIEAYENIDPYSRDNYKKISQARRVMSNLFDYKTILALLNELTKPANDDMAKAMKALEDAQKPMEACDEEDDY